MSRASAASLALLFLAPSAAAQTFVEDQRLVASDFEFFGQFGSSVSVSGGTLVVGAEGEGTGLGINIGAVYVFGRVGGDWVEEAKLVPSDDTLGDERTGHSIAIDGDTIVAGAYGDASLTGAAFVFVRQDGIWSQQAKLVPSVPQEDSLFGYSVDLSGDTAVIGAPSYSTAGVQTGAAFVFRRVGTSWTQEGGVLVGSDSKSGDQFGDAVTVDGDTLVVGANMHGFIHFGGAAYVFTRQGGTWTEQAELRGLDTATGDRFGSAVSLDQGRLLVGAEWDNLQSPATNDGGSCYVFEGAGAAWTQTARLQSPTPTFGAEFGASVSLLGDWAAVGSPAGVHIGFPGRVALLLASGSTWTPVFEMTRSDTIPFTMDQFGSCVAVTVTGAVVGHIGSAEGGLSQAGAVYAYGLPETARYCTAGTSASGCRALLSAVGSPSASAASGFTVLAAGVEGQKDGIFFFGTNGRQANSWGNGTSFQCVVPPVVRTSTMTGVGTVGGCNSSFALDLDALWCPACPKPAKNPGPGAIVQAQLWYRDPASTSNQTTSLTDAIEFIVGP